MVLYVVGLRKSKALKEDFGKHLAPKDVAGALLEFSKVLRCLALNDFNK